MNRITPNPPFIIQPAPGDAIPHEIIAQANRLTLALTDLSLPAASLLRMLNRGDAADAAVVAERLARDALAAASAAIELAGRIGREARLRADVEAALLREQAATTAAEERAA